MITELDFLFCIIWWIQILEKTFIKIKNKNICNIINGFTVTFDKLNASLLNKYIYFFYLTPNVYMVVYHSLQKIMKQYNCFNHWY